MTSPGGDVPEGAYVGTAGQSNSITDLNNLTEAEAKRRMQGAVAPSFNRQRDGVWQAGGLLGNLANLLFGEGAGTPAERLADGMTDLSGRVELMAEVSGYCGMYMTKNWTYIGGNTYRKLRFDAPYGPPKSANPDIVNNRIVLNKGTWSVSLHVATASVVMIIPGELWVRARIDVYTPSGALHSRRWLDWHSHGRPTTAFYQVPVVVPEDGYYVEVWVANSADWMGFSGGTERTLIFVNRWDLRTDNRAELTSPPDGGNVS